MSATPALLLILDGYGMAPDGPTNAITTANTPTLDALWANWPRSVLSASGLDVGLPDGQFGNSEVGHTNLGAGRVVYQELTRINVEIDEGGFYDNAALRAAVARCAGDCGPALHLCGLVSDGGVHSHIGHVRALIELARRACVERVYIHAFTDGRDVPPTSGLHFLTDLEAHLRARGTGVIASVCGRYYAMDRDNRWERVQRAYECLVGGDALRAHSLSDYIEGQYAQGITDEFLPPVLLREEGRIAAGDSLIFFNFRPDRARELTRALIDPDFDGFERKGGALPLCYVTFTQYDATFADIPFAPTAVSPWQDGHPRPVRVAFEPEPLDGLLGEILSAHGLRQTRLAETEKYAHVTFFFNGGREQPYEGESRILVPSPKVATYDLQPRMSAPEVALEGVAALERGDCDLLICNLANCDMVGHTGVLSAAVEAVEAVDAAVGLLVDAVLKAGGFALLTADHGNAECMEEDGQPMTAHTANPVVLIVIGAIGSEGVALKDGRLCDVAPTLLALMGIKKPPQMTGESLLV